MTFSDLRTSAMTRLRQLATGGVVALVLGGLLATGMTSAASATALPASAPQVTAVVAPAEQGVSTVTVNVAGPTGAAITKAQMIYFAAVPLDNGAYIQDKPPVNGTFVKNGQWSFSLEAGQDYTFEIFTTVTYGQLLGGSTPYGSAALGDARTINRSSGPSTLDISLFAPSKVSGVVKSTTKVAIKNVQVTLYEFDGTDYTQVAQEAYTSATGAYTFPNVRPGNYAVGFVSYGAYVQSQDLPKQAAVVAPGANAVINGTLALGGKISGVVTGFKVTHNYGYEDDNGEWVEGGEDVIATVATPQSGIVVNPVKLTIEDGMVVDTEIDWNAGSTMTTATGKFLIQGLAPGTYSLSFKDYNWNEQNLLTDSFKSLPLPYPVDANRTFTVAGTATTAASGLLPLQRSSQTATGYVTGFTSVPLDNEYGDIEFTPDTGGLETTLWLDADGSFSGNLTPGRYTWQAFPGESDDWLVRSTYRSKSGTITVVAGNENEPIVIPIEAKDSSFTFSSNPLIEGEGSRSPGDVLTVGAGFDATRGYATYQWTRDGISIFGAKSSSYTVSGGDVNTVIAARVTYQSFDNDYYEDRRSVTATSEGVTVVANTSLASITAPAITSSAATPVVGSVLTANPGTWTVPATRFEYQWETPLGPISGATGKTFTVTAAQLALPIAVTVTGVKPGYVSETAFSNILFIEPGAAPKVVKAPVVTGTTVGQIAGNTKYTVTPGTWSLAGTTPSYAWYINGELQESATQVFVAPTATTGAVSVTVNASKNGYHPGTVQVLAKKGTVGPDITDATVYFGMGNPVAADTQLEVGTTLETDTNFDVDMPFGTTKYSYQWERLVGTKWTAIAKATAASYTVTTLDVAKSLRVTITATHPYYTPVKQTVAAGVGILNPDIYNAASKATLTISGTGAVTSTTTSAVSAWPIAGVVNAYQWGVAVPAVGEAEPTWVAIPKATATTFIPTAAQVGKNIQLRVTSSKAGYTSAVQYSNELAVVAATKITVTVPTTTVSDSAKVGVKLTGKAATVDLPGVVRTYQWQVRDFGVDQAEWLPAAATGANLISYTPTGANYGSGEVQIRLVETIKKGALVTTSVSDGLQVGRGTLVTKVAPTIKVTAGAYTVVGGTWLPAAGTTTYEWVRNGVISESATTAVWNRTAEDNGQWLGVLVTRTVPGYESVSVPVFAQKLAAPTLSTPLTISAPKVGAPASVGEFEVVYSFAHIPNVTFQWYLANVAIKGATQSSYTPLPAQLGKALTVRATATSQLAATATFASAPVVVTAGAAAEHLTVVTAPSITPGATATASQISVQPGYAVTYAWYRAPFLGAPVKIVGATKATYLIQPADIGSFLLVQTTYTRVGYATNQQFAGAGFVGSGEFTWSVAPSLVGSGAAGTVLSINAGTVNDAPTLSYQWFRNGVLVPGATSSSITLLGSHLGDVFTATVTATKTGWQTKSISVEDVTVKLGAAPTTTAVLGGKVTGLAKECSTLAVSNGVWNRDGLTFGYNWQRSLGAAGEWEVISGATASTYLTDGSAAGYRFRAVVFAQRVGFADGVYSTAPTALFANVANCLGGTDTSN